MTNYLKRIADLDNPLPTDSPFFLPERPDNPAQEYVAEKKVKKILSDEEKDELKALYYKKTGEPATETWDRFSSERITEVLDGKGWVVPGLLTGEECEEIIELGEDWGIGEEDVKVPRDQRVRTSNRTNSYQNPELSIRLNKRLPEELLEAVEQSAPWTSVRGLHPNWRVARYRSGETFPAHQDQADSVIVKHAERVRQRYTSSHTLLINLTSRGTHFDGGQTRFFMDGDYSGRTVDICLPRGYALVFQQRGLYHAGLPVLGDGVKYIAQTGLLRAEPERGVITGPASVFKYAPGLSRDSMLKHKSDYNYLLNREATDAFLKI